MDIAAILNLKALLAGLAAALPLLIAAIPLQMFCEKSAPWRRLRPALAPLALAAGFVTCFAMQAGFPQSKNGIPWYLDEVWKLTVIAGILAGTIVAAAQLLPRRAAIPLLVLLAAALVLLMVRGPWIATPDRPAWATDDGLATWPRFAAALAAALLCYLAALAPATREPRLWLVGALVTWASAAAAAVMMLTWLDQRLGRLLVMLAILAGLAGALGIVRPLRGILGGAWQFLALIFGCFWMLALYYNSRLDPPSLPLSSLLLLGGAPLAAAVAWIPPLRRRPWLCLCVTAAVTAAFLIPALVIAAKFAPPPSE